MARRSRSDSTGVLPGVAFDKVTRPVIGSFSNADCGDTILHRHVASTTSSPRHVDPGCSDPSQAKAVQVVRRRAGRMTPPIWSALVLIITAASVHRFTGLDREGRWGDE